ncbi:glycosyltransferase family 2 protein [bacterium]|nr:glycosyltransferase family 2 protein [candidate division CSSED10-310 bacterium]
MDNVTYSVVLPVYNEELILEALYDRLVNALDALGEPYEVIFVNDGSHDRSLEILKSINQRDPRYRVISFSRNFGHQTAITAGINHTRGDAVIIMDADLQDPPEVLSMFLDKWREGYQVVYAIRTKRKENALKRLAYKVFYRLLAFVSDVEIPLDSGDFCVMDRRIVDLLNSMPERNRFVRGIRSWAGFNQIGMAYERDKRMAGEPKYTMTKLFKLAFDGIISFSKLPLRVASILGFIVSGFSFVYAFLTLLQKLFTDSTVPGYTTTVILISFLGGIQLITIGIIGEYLGRIFDEVKKRPLYIVADKIGFEHTSE